MFFSKNKKTDSKIRFQQTGFRRQLQNARGYKRQGTINPGSKHFWLKLILGAAVVLILYLIYIPNFLFVKHIQVNGVSGNDQQQIVSLAQGYIKLKPLSAQGNWWLISTQKLSSYILQNDNQITSISSIKRRFPNTIIVNVTPRTTAYNVTIPLQQILVSNDGIVQRDITSIGTSTPVQTAGLIPVTVDIASSTEVGQKLFLDGLLANLNLLNNLAKAQLGLTLDHFELPTVNPDEIFEFVSSGFELKFNTGLNLTQNINQVQLILNSLADSQKKNLYYIDIRFADKGFVCYKNTPCVQDIQIPQAPNVATSTTINP